MEAWASILCLQGLSLVGLYCTWVIVEWIWRPWRLVTFCRNQGMNGFRFLPVVGQLPQVSKVLNHTSEGSGHDWEALSTARKCVETHGKVFYFMTGKTVRICITDPNLIKAVLDTNADSYSKPSFIHVLDILRTGIFASSGDVWLPQRQLFGRSFTSKEIKTEISLITECTRAALKRWLPEIDSGSGELSVYKRVSELTLDVIKALAFGMDPPGTEDRTSSEEAESFNRYLLNCRGLVFGRPASIPGYRYLPTQLNKEVLKDQTWLTGVIEDLIIARSSEYVASSSEGREHKDILDVLLTTTEISSQQLRDNGLTFLLAGHHTTASLLSWTMYLLALHPLWQERARAEVEEFCSDGIVEWSTLSHFKTLTMILQETLRLFPPIPLLGRLCVKENTVGPYVIPQGVEIMIPTAVIHRDRELWGDDADQFQPMRFANGLGKACKHILGYIPFGSGPRTCVGQNLALAEARTVLAAILPALSWSLGPGYLHSPDVSLTLQPKFDIPIIMKRLS
ncbi:protein MpCYP765-like [Marchantia polymorpha subsp. ruderalis]